MKNKTRQGSELLEEYDFKEGVRGKHAERYAEGNNLVLLAPDMAEFFPDSKSVNDALRSLVKIARQATKGAS